MRSHKDFKSYVLNIFIFLCQNFIEREYLEFNIKPEKIEFNICICADLPAEKLDKCPPSVTISVLCLNIGIFILIIYQAKISPTDKKYYLMDSEIPKRFLSFEAEPPRFFKNSFVTFR